MLGKLGFLATVTVALIAVALTLGAALSAAASWVGWWGAPSLPTDAEAASLSALLVPGPVPARMERRDVVFDYPDDPQDDRWKPLLLGSDDYEAGFVEVTTPVPDSAAALRTAEAALRTGGWELRREGGDPLRAELGGDFVELYASDVTGRVGPAPTAVTMLMRRAEPQYVPAAGLGGWVAGLLIGVGVVVRGLSRRARRTLEVLTGFGVLALLPGTIIATAYLLLYLTSGGPDFPDAPWAGYMFWLIKPASAVGGLLLLLAALVALFSRRRREGAPAQTAETAETAEIAAEASDQTVVIPAVAVEPEPDAPQADLFVRHEEPVWRERADFVINAALPGRFEQIWARQVGADEFEVCCIPFHLYGVALGDVVKTSPVGGLQYVVERVTKPSGRHVFRVFFSDPLQPQAEITHELAVLEALMEYPEEHVLAVDARDDEHARQLEAYLRAAQQAGNLGFEPGRQPSGQPG